MNRSGGGTANGTNVITYAQNDPHNDFTFAQLFNYVCGKYPYVRNGENGCVGPFTNGSGLNARYDGDPVVEISAYNEGKCVAIPNFDTTLTALEQCGAPGYVFVLSHVNNAYYLVSVGESNFVYGQTHRSNAPQWLNDDFPTAMEVTGDASTSWGCVGTGLGDC
jgi:hypothetical protein